VTARDVDERLERATDNEVLTLAREVEARLLETDDEALRRRAETLRLLVRALDL
jgi:hypothetical protein